VDAVLADWRTAPVDESLRATLGLLETMTLRPAELRPDDIERVRARGVGDDAIADAMVVAACFNLIDRVADALGAEPMSNVLSRKQLLAHEAACLERGYV